MIFTGIKRKSNQIFFNKKLIELLGSSKIATSKEVKKVIVFLDNVSEKEIIKKNLSTILKISKNSIEVVVFKNLNKNKLEKEIFTPKDFGWFGTIRSERLKNILTKKYDLLINYSKTDTLYKNLVVLQSKTAFRVGFAHLDNRFYDLLINCNASDISLFNKEMKKYLYILKII